MLPVSVVAVELLIELAFCMALTVGRSPGECTPSCETVGVGCAIIVAVSPSHEGGEGGVGTKYPFGQFHRGDLDISPHPVLLLVREWHGVVRLMHGCLTGAATFSPSSSMARARMAYGIPARWRVSWRCLHTRARAFLLARCS